MSARWPNTTVIGAGLIGASLAGAGREAGVFQRVVGAGRSQANLDTALVHRLVDAVTTDLEEAVAEADLIVLATPGVRAIELFAELRDVAPATAVFTDVGSVKEPVVEAAAAAGLAERFVGAHPLAGKADSGASSADAALFRGRTCVLTPSAASDPAAVEGITEMWTAVGSHCLTMDPGVHDAALATTSHLPQMAAFALALVAAGDEATLRPLIASGFRDTTRLAASNPEMWSAIARLNRPHVLDALDAFAARLADLRAAVDAGDDEALTALFETARKFRRGLDT
jgi:prephenate dehydrogenase